MSRYPRLLRMLAWYYRRPLLGYLVFFAIGAAWSFAPRGTQLPATGLLFLPWVLAAAAVAHLPLIGGAVRRLTAPMAVRRNHALEHGTVQLILRAYGVSKGVGGRAEAKGFRVSGVRHPRDIERAFAEFMALPPDQLLPAAVSNRCGSMVVVSQGVGIALIVLTLIAVAVWQPSSATVAALLAAQAIIFLLGRRPLGRLLQARRLLAVDFRSARIRRIVKVRANHLLERPPVYLVETVVESAA